MNRPRPTDLPLLLLLLIATGCIAPTATPPPHTDWALRTDASNYTVNTLIVYLPEFQATDWNGDVEARLNQLLQTGHASIRRLPALFLQPGETRQINGMATYTYPTHFNPNGAPVKTKTIEIGALYRVELIQASASRAELKLHYEQNNIINWQSFGSEEIAPFRTYPLCSKEQLSTQITLQPQTWRVAGTCNTREQPRQVIILICLQPPSGSALK